MKTDLKNDHKNNKVFSHSPTIGDGQSSDILSPTLKRNKSNHRKNPKRAGTNSEKERQSVM